MDELKAIHYGAVYYDIPLLCALGRMGANLNVLDHSGRSSIYLILTLLNPVYSNNNIHLLDINTLNLYKRTLTWFLSRGADITNLLYKGQSILQYYLMNNPNIDIEICKLLLDYGANINDLKYCSNKQSKELLINYYNNIILLKPILKMPILCPCGNNILLTLCHGWIR